VVAGPFSLSEALTLDWRGMEGRRIREERVRVEAEYRKILKSSVEFEKKIRDRWREKNREKNRRIAELERRVAELEQELKGGATGRQGENPS
jgi:hypothetical protein